MNSIKAWWSNTLLRQLFCRHRYVKEMTEGDYWESSNPDAYVLTLCNDCGKILHGRWMGLKKGNKEVEL